MSRRKAAAAKARISRSPPMNWSRSYDHLDGLSAFTKGPLFQIAIAIFAIGILIRLVEIFVLGRRAQLCRGPRRQRRRRRPAHRLQTLPYRPGHL
jgi:hypothetical protein